VTVALAAVFVVTLASALLLTPLARRVGIRLGMVDKPRPGELQRRVVARTGGYALIGAVLVGLLVSLLLVQRNAEEWWRLAGFAAGLLVVIPVAIVDDRMRLGPGPQLLGQIVAALLPMAFGLWIDGVATPDGSILPLVWWIGMPFTILWVVGMINTLNWIDTSDGLAGGVGLIAALVLLARTIEQGQLSVAVLPLVLAAACLGFLPYNFNPARVIMGTSGSMLLGYALAMLAIFGGAKIATALMVLGLPIYDTALVILQRLIAGRSPFQGGDDAHLVHRLAHRGWGPRRIALAAYAVCLLFGVGGLTLSGAYKAYLFGGAAFGALVIALLLVRTTRPTNRGSAS
jgi:UDP-GlcNAc:undecaprenyl-phosphate GlcNAc-1-phosphate transferase